MKFASLTTAIVILVASIIFSCVPACQSPSNLVRVTRVIDGDTIVIENGNHVRYIGINAPEHGQLYYREAMKFNEKLVNGKRVLLETDISDKDKYGRLLRYIYIRGTFVNAEMVRNGYARANAYPPDIKHQNYLELMEIEAKKQGVGIWNTGKNERENLN